MSFVGKPARWELTLLTHRHHDHADSAERFRQLTNAPVRAFDPGYCVDGAALQDGEVISIEGVTPQIEVVHTPGHTSDCVCFLCGLPPLMNPNSRALSPEIRSPDVTPP